MSTKSSKKQKALALALAISLNLSTVSSIIHAEETDTTQTAPAGPSDPAPEGKTPTVEATPEPLPNAGETGDNVPQQQQQTTVWDPAQSQPCDENTMCDPANVSPANQEWKDILSMMAILFGERSSSDGTGTADTGGSVGITGDTGSTTVTPPTLPDEFSTIAPFGDPDTSFSETPIGPDLSGIQLGLLGGIPLSPNASYSWTRVGPGAIKVQALVYPLNPEVDSSTKFGALVTSTNPSVHVYPPAQYASETYTTGGNYSKVFKFMTMEYAKGHAPRFGSVTVQVNAKVYEGSTALCSAEDSNCDNGLESGSEFDSNGNLISNTGNGVTNTGSTSTGGISTNGNLGNSNIDDLFSNLGNGSNSSNTGNSSNASSPDWLADGFSSNNSGDSNNGTVPTDFGSQFANNSTTPTDNQFSTTDTTPTASADGGNGQFAYADGNGISSTGSAGLNGRDATSTNSGNNNGENTTSSADGPLNSLFSKIDSAIGNDPSSSNSLTSKFAGLINTGDKTAKTIAEMSQPKRLPGAIEDSFTAASNAELADVAKQMLIGYGTSQEDIKAGKLFDAGSAYTDPSDAWNLNRMSTILKSKNLTVK